MARQHVPSTASKHIYLFISFVGPNYSRSAVILNGDTKLYDRKYFQVSNKFWESYRQIKAIEREYSSQKSCFVIMSPCHKLTPVVRLATSKPVILDAGWPLTEGAISRNNISPKGLVHLVRNIAIDFAALHFANLTLFETKSQQEFTSTKFLLRLKKTSVSYTGVNEKAFNADCPNTSLTKSISDFLRLGRSDGIILFRGKINNESGFSTILSVAESLPNFKFILGINEGFEKKKQLENCLFLNDFSDLEMKYMYSISDIAIGQFSNHPRLARTIPHKAFEAAFFEIPYITARNKGILEIADDYSVEIVDNPSALDLKKSLVKLMSNVKLRCALTTNFKQQYLLKCSQQIVNIKFEKITAPFFENQD